MSKKCILLTLKVLNERYMRRSKLRHPVFEGCEERRVCLNLINNTRNPTKLVLGHPVV